MIKKYLTLAFVLICFLGNAQKPIVKIDFDMQGRRANEVNEPGYTSWVVGANSTSKTVSGITFAVKATAQKATASLHSSWSKLLVQSPHLARLVNDGILVDNGEGGATMELRITGLPIGKHTIQTYHNVWQNPAERDFCPINLYLNGKLVHSNVKRSLQVKTSTDATILLTEMEVTKAGQEMILLIESVKDFVPITGKKANLNICLNAFELNAIDGLKQAREPIPNDAYMHVNADNGSFNFQWKPSVNGKNRSHTLFFGSDSASVSSATTSNLTICKGEFPLEKTDYLVQGLDNSHTYYWRVDETDSNGVVTKGKIWSFRPRHLAFRGAEGYGRFATGGRGGKVVIVTNLDDDGPGSLREAISNSIGPRTIVFNVSGIIHLKSRLVVKDKYVTIAGQTAPGKGICLRGAPLGIGCETICRFIRSRLGGGTTYDGLGAAGADHSIIDHCSISWTIDESFSSRGGKNLTLQRTLISEALNMANHDKYGSDARHGYAGSIGGDIGSFHHNLLAHNNGRNWSLAGGLDGDGFYAGRMDIFNNIVYNWQGRTTDGGAHEVNFVNNFYKKGVASGDQNILKAQLEGIGKGSQSYYYSGNILQGTDGSYLCDGTDNTCSRTYVLSNNQVVDWQVWSDKPFFPSYAKIETAEDAYKSVLSDVGCTMPIFDDHDKRIINETLNGTFTYTGSRTQVGGIVDHQDDVGGYENYPEITRGADFDSDQDGLPNWWEISHGTNPNSEQGNFSDSNADPDGDGYTALEDYLEWMSVPHFTLREKEKTIIELSDFTRGYINPTYSCYNSADFDLSFENSKMKITSNSSARGINYLNIKGIDSEGSEFTLVFGFYVGEK